MDEQLKNEKVTEESVVEQRPSTKYGRTAYQQQLQEEQAAQGQQIPPQQNGYQYWENGQNPYNQTPYQQPQYNAYSIYQEPVPEVKNIYAYILMALVGISGILSGIVNIMLSDAFAVGNTMAEVVDAILEASMQPGVSMLSSVGNLLNWVVVALLVLDIFQLKKAGKKIMAAILFAIFLRPLYFIWRAYLLGQKKMGAILYTIGYYVVSLSLFGVFFGAYMEFVMRLAAEMGIY